MIDMAAIYILWVIMGIVAAVWLVNSDTNWRDTPGISLITGLTTWPVLLLIVVIHELGKGILFLAGFVNSFRGKKDDN